MQTFITVRQLQSTRHAFTLIDVRKPVARAQSGLFIAGSVFRHPFDAANWKDDFPDKRLVIYCVHGHEISQSVSGFLREEGIDCAYLEGGFEAARKAGMALMPIADGSINGDE